MNKLREVIRYLLVNSKYPSKLTKTKVTKLVYLADWKHTIKNKKQLTDIKWFFDHYGPYVSDVYFVAENDPKVIIKSGYNAFGNPKETLEFRMNREKFNSKLNECEQEILKNILYETDYMNWREFIDHVYETAPVKMSKKFTRLNLKNIAKKTLKS